MTEEKLVTAQVTREVKIAKTSASALLHYRGARNAWSKKIGPKAADALELLCKELAPRVEEAGLTLEAREQALNQERQDDEPVRAARDARSAALNQTILSVKGLVSATFGDEALITYGLSSAVPPRPMAATPTRATPRGCCARTRAWRTTRWAATPAPPT